MVPEGEPWRRTYPQASQCRLRALVRIHRKEHTACRAVEIRVDAAACCGGGPAGQEALTVLNGLTFQKVDELRAGVRVNRKGRSRLKAYELHGPPPTGAQVLDFNAWRKGRFAPGYGAGICKAESVHAGIPFI